MKYKAVIFDLFGTLIRNFPSPKSNENLRRMATELSVSPDDFVNLWHDTFEERMTGIFKNYQACIKHICRKLGAQARESKIEMAADIRLEMNKREVMEPREDAITTLTYLRSNGYKTGLISDCSIETTLIWPDTPLAPLIDEPVFSCLVGIKKPDPRIYQIAVDRLAVKPEECLYIADGIGQELASASSLGMHATQILVPGEDQYDHYRDEWNGPLIGSLTEILTLIE